MALDLHFHDSEFTVFGPRFSKSRFGRSSDAAESGHSSDEHTSSKRGRFGMSRTSRRAGHDEGSKIDVEDAESGRSSKFGAFLALMVLVGIAFAVRRYRNGGTTVEIEGADTSVTESVEA